MFEGSYQESSLLASDVMTPNPRTCSEFSTVLEAVLIFRDANCGAVPVLENGKPVAILTDRDVALAVADEANLATTPVSEIVTAGVVCIADDAPLSEVREKFATAGVRRLLVVDAKGQLVGIISLADISEIISNHELGEVVAEIVRN